MRCILTILVLLCAFGCQSLSRPFPERSYYTILDGSPAPATPTDDAVHIEVAQRAQISAPFGSRSFQYRVADGEYAGDYYHAWADDPGELIRTAVIRRFNSRPAFFALSQDGDGESGDLSIRIEVDSLFADVTATNAPVAVVSLSATVRDMSGETLLSRRYQAETPSDSANAIDVLGAWNTGLGGLLDEVVADVASTMFPD